MERKNILEKGACFISGLFDLVPIQLSYLNTVLQVDTEMAIRNSPLRLAPLSHCPLVVAVGEAETAAFQEQSKALYEGWKDSVKEMEFLLLPGLHHFSVVEAMVGPGGALHKAICRLMGIDIL